MRNRKRRGFVSRLFRIIGMLVALAVVLAALGLAWAHVAIRDENPPLPIAKTLAAVGSGDIPVRLSWIETSMQRTPAGVAKEGENGWRRLVHPVFVLEWKDGRILLVDTGARLHGYCSDLTRCFPVAGVFTPRQRAVYDAVLEAQQAAIAACRPGATLADVHESAWHSLARAGFGPGFVHGTSHHLGIETHDAGDVHAPLEPGCVITVEPGVYLPDESLGIRIEDDVLVTAAGARVLSAAIPSDPDEIERRAA